MALNVISNATARKETSNSLFKLFDRMICVLKFPINSQKSFRNTA
jgi:hypothetical protein